MPERFEIVPFHQQQILTVQTEGAVCVVMKPIVEALGLTWRKQHERITNHPIIYKGVTFKVIPSAGGMQEMMALDLEQFHGWLITLDSRRVTDERVRDNIILYQEHAFRVVFEHFHGKIGSPKPQKPPQISKIAAQNQVIKLLSKLRAARHAEERKAMHQMLDALCQDIGIDTPALENLGHEIPPTPDMLAHFWQAIDTLQHRGHRVNMSRKDDQLALYLPEIRRLFRHEGLSARTDTHLRNCFQASISPRYLGNKSVNCRDGKVRHCWVFERNR